MFLLLAFLLLLPGLAAVAGDSNTRMKSSPTRRLATNRAHRPALEAHPRGSIRFGVCSPLAASGSADMPDTIRFAVIGDYGLEGDAEAEVAAVVRSWNPDFIITTGDNNYPDGAAETIDQNIGQYYSDFIYPYVGSYGEGAPFNRFFPSLGNHDWDSEGAQPYLDYFTLPGNERYYDFVWGPVHFFALDSDLNEPDGVTSDSDQAAWLQTALAGSNSLWKIVYMHHPPFSSGPHGSTDWMQWPYGAWGATAVLAGHDHTYERIEQDGVPYFVNGIGGNGIYDFREPVEGSQVQYNSEYGAMLVDASYEAITFQLISRTGEVVDIFTRETSTPARGFYALLPCRVLDTRSSNSASGGPALAANSDRTFTIAGQCGVPSAAKTLSLNVTVTEPTADGSLRLYPEGTPLPVATTISYRKEQTRANNSIASLGSGGALRVRCDQAAGSVHVIMDVNGYFR